MGNKTEPDIVNLLQLEFLLAIFLPTFGLVFSLGWLRTRRQPRFLKLLLSSLAIGAGGTLLVIVILFSFLFYTLQHVWVDEHSSTPLSVENARREKCPIPLPDSARQVRFAKASRGLAFETLVRFEAPAEVCRHQAQLVLDARAMEWGKPTHVLSLTPMSARPLPEDHDMLGRASWFDRERIEHGAAAYERAQSIQFWIDDERGIFYCKITD